MTAQPVPAAKGTCWLLCAEDTFTPHSEALRVEHLTWERRFQPAWTPRTIRGVGGLKTGRWGLLVMGSGVAKKVPPGSDLCVQPLEAPLAPYQTLTCLSCHLPPRGIIKSSASPLIFKRKSPCPERPAPQRPRGSRYPPAPATAHQAPNSALGAREARGVCDPQGQGTWVERGTPRTLPHRPCSGRGAVAQR